MGNQWVMGGFGRGAEVGQNSRTLKSSSELFRVVQSSEKSTVYQRLTDLPPFVRGDVRGSCEVWGW